MHNEITTRFGWLLLPQVVKDELLGAFNNSAKGVWFADG